MAILSKKIAQADQKNCVACGTCTKVCPREAIKVHQGCYAVVDSFKCVGCGMCATVCPANCINLIDREGAGKHEKEVV